MISIAALFPELGKPFTVTAKNGPTLDRPYLLYFISKIF